MTITTHSKLCLSTALINAVENFRDDEFVSDDDFTAAMVAGKFNATATGYIEDSMIPCVCRVFIAKRIISLLDTDGVARAQSYATSELQCGTITDDDYAAIQALSEGRLPSACIHAGLFFPYDGDINDTSTCYACGVDVPNYEL